METPEVIQTNEVNVGGFLNMLIAARDAGASRFVYASSSAVYGDHPSLPKIEDQIGKQLSPYALTKFVNELYASIFATIYSLETVGLRFFNVFGPRQDPNGPYAAVIPKWVGHILRSESCPIFGDGETSRDFSYIENVIDSILKAALTQNPKAVNQVYNVAQGQKTSLKELQKILARKISSRMGPEVVLQKPTFHPFRKGDVRHSLANISKARELLDYKTDYSLEMGLDKSLAWYISHRKEL